MTLKPTYAGCASISAPGRLRTMAAEDHPILS
jgi:hypothetical protein